MVIPLTTQHYAMLAQPALHRRHPGQALVVLVGQRRALAIAVRGSARRRWSKLREWLSPAA